MEKTSRTVRTIIYDNPALPIGRARRQNRQGSNIQVPHQASFAAARNLGHQICVMLMPPQIVAQITRIIRMLSALPTSLRGESESSDDSGGDHVQSCGDHSPPNQSSKEKSSHTVEHATSANVGVQARGFCHGDGRSIVLIIQPASESLRRK